MIRNLIGALAGLATVLILSSSANAGYVKLKGNWDITNNSGTSANDFHITAQHPDPTAAQIGNDFFNDGFFQQKNVNVSGNGGQNVPMVINLNWIRSGAGLINAGETIHIGYEYRANNANVQILDSYWTANGVKTSGEQPKIPGFKVGSLALSNNTGEAITIENLNFLVSSVDVPLAALIPYTLGGFGTSLGSGTFVPTFGIPDGGEVDVTPFLPSQPQSGQFLLWQFTSYADASPAFTTTGVFEAEIDSVPEPSTFGLAALGLVSLGLVAWRRCRRS